MNEFALQIKTEIQSSFSIGLRYECDKNKICLRLLTRRGDWWYR